MTKKTNLVQQNRRRKKRGLKRRNEIIAPAMMTVAARNAGARQITSRFYVLSSEDFSDPELDRLNPF